MKLPECKLRLPLIFSLTLALSLNFLLSLNFAIASPKSACSYRTAEGKIKQVSSINQVPTKYRGSAFCGGNAPDSNPTTALARPQDIELSGNIAYSEVPTNLGTMKIRWPRQIISLFDQNPNRAVQDAAKVVSSVLRKPGFSTRVQSLNLDWQIVFMDENLPETQIPTFLVSNCHPGWMTPPANIYIVAQRVAAGCGGGQAENTSKAKSNLTQVLVHEMGHAVEFYLLEGRGSIDRMRSEGFATWFESYAAEFSPILDSDAINQRNRAAARIAIERSPDRFDFSGTSLDYARASLYFSAIVSRGGLFSLMQIYELIYRENIDFLTAIERVLRWDSNKLNYEISQLIK